MPTDGAGDVLIVGISVLRRVVYACAAEQVLTAIREARICRYAEADSTQKRLVFGLSDRNGHHGEERRLETWDFGFWAL